MEDHKKDATIDQNQLLNKIKTLIIWPIHTLFGSKQKVKAFVLIVTMLIIARANRPKYTKIRSYKSYKSKYHKSGVSVDSVSKSKGNHTDEISLLENMDIEGEDDKHENNKKEGVDESTSDKDIDVGDAADKFSEKQELEALAKKEKSKGENDYLDTEDSSMEHDAQAQKLEEYESKIDDENEGFQLHLQDESEENDYGDLYESLTKADVHTTLPPEFEEKIDYSKHLTSRQLERRLQGKLNDDDKNYIKRILGLDEMMKRQPLGVRLTCMTMVESIQSNLITNP